MPRPDLAERLGVTYRRIPVLAIGKDVYCDSSLIASVLERRFPPSEGFGTLFPRRKGGGSADTGMIKAFAMFYADKALGQLGSETLPYNKFTPEFLKDRTEVSSSAEAWLRGNALNDDRSGSGIRLMQTQLRGTSLT